MESKMIKRIMLVLTLLTAGLFMITLITLLGLGLWFEEVIEKEINIPYEIKLNNSFEIAKKDTRVQKLIEGKEYNLDLIGIYYPPSNFVKTTIIGLEAEGKYYKITVDMDNKIVKSIEELSPKDSMRWCGSSIICSKILFEVAKKNSKIQELINGKKYEYAFRSWSEEDNNIALIELKVEGKNYEIIIDLNSEKVKSVKQVQLEYEDEELEIWKGIATHY